MRCRQARIRLENQSRLDPELTEHLNGCPECSQLAKAQVVLRDSFRSLRTEPGQPTTPLTLIRSRIGTHQDSKEFDIMAIFKNNISSHPRLGLGLTFGVIALLFMLLVPLPYQRIAGYSVQFSGLDPNLPSQELAQAIKVLGYGNVSMKIMAKENEAEILMSNLPSLKAARDVVALVRTITGTTNLANITPQLETVSASLYAQAREKMIKVEVDGTGKTDEQIEAEIASKLAAQGCDKPLVYFKREPGGKKTIEMQLKTNNCSNINPSQQTLEIDTHDKSDEQIKAEIQTKLAAEGHPNSQVSITTTGSDSTKECKIEIQLQDSTGQ
jgi:hypothetical protein